MIYEKEITVPPNTARNNRQRTTFKITAGVLHFIEIHFPPGCCNLVKAALNLGGVQIFPSTKGMDLAGDTWPVRFEDYLPIEAGRNYLTVYTWNEDDFYSHTLRIRVGILRPEDLEKAKALGIVAGTITGTAGSPSKGRRALML